MVIGGAAGWSGWQASTLRWGLLAPVALVALAVLITAPRDVRLRLSIIAASLIVAFWAPDPIVTGFGVLTALMLAAFCAHAKPLALSATPALILAAISSFLTARHGVSIAVGTSISLALAALLAPLGALLALRAPDFSALALGFTLGLFGVALGAAWLGLPPIMLLASACAALSACGIILIDQRLTAAAGHIALDGLGGLARGMPDLSFVLLALLLGVSALPPGPAFDVLILLAHALSPAPSLPAGAFFLGVALWAGLSAVAALRGFALVALGRPRSLRAAAAEDQRDRLLAAMAGLAAAMLLLGLIAVPDRLIVILITSVGALLVAALAGLARKRRLLERPHWTEGFAKPSLWLPFDDPTTQMTATGFSAITLGSAYSLQSWLWHQSTMMRLWLTRILAP